MAYRSGDELDRYSGDIDQFYQQRPQGTSTIRQVVKAASAVTLGGSLLTLSGLILAGTVIALIVATPVFLFFCPILVPAVVTVGLIITGFLASGGIVVAAVTALTFMYKSSMGRNLSQQLATKAKGMDIKGMDIEHSRRGPEAARRIALY